MIKSMRRMYSIYRRARGRLILSQIMVLLSATATIAFASLNQKLVNQGIEMNNYKMVVDTGLQMLILALVSGVCLAVAAYIAVYFSQGIGYVIRTLLYEKIQTFSFANFDRFPTSAMMVRLNADVVNVQNAMLYSTLLTLYAPFMLLVTLVFTIIKTPELVWLLVVIIAAVLGAMVVLVPPVFRAYDERQKRLDKLNETMQENLTGVRVVKAFTREDYEVERFKQRSDDLRKPAYQAAFRVAFLTPLLTGTTQLGIALAIWIGGDSVLAGKMDLGQLVAFTQYLSLIVAPLAILAIVVPFVLRGDTSAERILEVYDDEATVQDKEDAQPLDMEKIEGRIVFENVSFAFRRPDGEFDPPAIKNINLTIEPGQQVGFLGATGAGKSALVNLIPRFYDVTEGRITIDGVDVRDIPQENLRQYVGIALQEAVLFKGDVRFNLKFGAPQADDDVMIAAAKAAEFVWICDEYPQQWDAPVSSTGPATFPVDSASACRSRVPWCQNQKSSYWMTAPVLWTPPPKDVCKAPFRNLAKMPPLCMLPSASAR